MKLIATWLKVLLLIILAIIGLVVLLNAIFLFAYWARQFDEDSWHQLPIHNIRINDSHWQRLDIDLPIVTRGSNNIMEYEVAIPNRYQLVRDKYIINIELNPTNHGSQANIQIVALAISDTAMDYLKIEPSREGNCGELLDSTSFFIVNKNAVGFAVEDDMENCGELARDNDKLLAPLVINPITLKIYDGEDLIGEEQINLEVFYNGIHKYMVSL